VHAVTDFGERSLRDVEKIQTRSTMSSSKSFNNVGRYRVRRFAHLSTELEPFRGRKMLDRQLMQANEQIVGPLPRHERMVSLI
jgi:hypothetical protein